MVIILAVDMNNESIREQTSRAKQEFRKLAHERHRFEDMVLRLGPMLEGSFTKRYTRCKKPGCKCERGERHGPYFSISKKDEAGKTRLEYIRPGEIVAVSEMLANRRQFRAGLKRLKKAQKAVDEALLKIERLMIRQGATQRADLRKS